MIAGGATLPTAWRSLSILVVEDEPMIAALLAELLTEMGHHVCGVVGEEAKAVCESARLKPDLLIVDAALCAGSGVRAVEGMTTLGQPQHIFTSGDARAVRLRKPEALVLQKPYDEADLAQAISEAMA